MDPEIQREFEEQLRQMSDMLSQINSTMAGTVKNIQNQTSAISGNTASVKQQTDANNQLSTTVTGRTKAEEAAAIANDKFAKSATLYSNAIDSTKSAVMGFGKALTSTEEGFKKYGSAVSGAGDAALAIGKNFGILGTILGSVVKGLTFFASDALAMHDTMIQMNRDFTKFAGVIPNTVGEMANLARDAGYAGERMGILAKTTETIGKGLVALGDTAGQGAVKFTKMAAVGDEVYKSYSKLGVAQEDLTKMQAMYIKSQAQSGRSYDLQTKTAGQLQKESLAYVDNLLRMSAITGENADELERNREVLRSEFEERVKVRQEELEAQRLDKEGRTEEAEAIRNESKTRQAMLQKLSDEQGPAIASMYGRVLRTGAFDEFSAGLAAQGQSAADLQKMVKGATTDAEREAAARKVSQMAIEGTDGALMMLGDSLQFGGAELGKSFGILNEQLGKNETSIGRTMEERRAAADDDLKAKKEQIDADAQARAEQEEKDREFQRQYQDTMLTLARTIMPSITEATELATAALREFNSYIPTIKEYIEKLKNNISTVITVLGVLVGVSVLGKVISIFRTLGTVTGGLVKAFKGAMAFLSTLLPGRKTPKAPAEPKKGADGRYRDARGRFASAPSGGGKILKLAKGVAGGIGGLLGGLALDYGADKAAEAGHTKTAAGLSTGSAALTGAGMGATVGSIIPGVGTVVGGAVGGLLGGAYGLYQNFDGLTGGAGPGAAPSVNSRTGVTDEKTATEKAKETTEKQATITEKQAVTAESTKISSELVSEKNKTSTTLFGKLVASFGKIVAADGRIVAAFGRMVSNFDVSVGKFDTTIKDLTDKLSAMTFGSTVGGDAGTPSGAAIPQNIQGNLELIAQGMRKKGFGDENYINAVLGNVMKESGGRFDKQEDIAGYSKTSNSRIRNIFKTKTKGMSDTQLDALKADPQAFANTMYGDRGGNKEPGDGWKFRGRGPIQLTGRENYAKASKDIYGDDRLVKNPDLVLEPAVGVEVVAWFMAQNEKKMRKSLGFSPDQALSKQEAALLATSQIAGQKITRGSGYLGTENLQKAESFAASMPTGVGAGGKFSSGGGAGGQRGAANAASEELISTKPSNVKVGNKADLSGVDSKLLSRFFTAAKEFGRDININSAYRSDEYQAELVVRHGLGEPGIFTPAKPKDDTTITYKGKQYTVPGSGRGSKHGRGEALDISTDRGAFDPFLAKYGLHRPHLPADPPHVELKAAKGGIFDGPTSGYPVELHGGEMVAPLTMDSILMKLAKTPALSAEGDMFEKAMTGGGGAAGNDNTDAILRMHSELINVLSSKLDNMIDILDEGNDINDKIFKHSMV